MEAEIKGSTYRAGRLTPHQQFHVLRRLGPTLVAALIMNGKDMAKLPEEALFGLVQPLLEALGRMANADADFVLNTCLSVVEKKVADKWAKVWVPTGKSDDGVPEGRFMFEDIDMPIMLRLVHAALRENLSNFSVGQLAKA